ncbi:hypothetical protein EIP86_002803 [Pleurotus ostreatoroseus]|nr:hypothetical protein EIP86_002803 [Pleurotus ostreatoroseus]
MSPLPKDYIYEPTLDDSKLNHRAPYYASAPMTVSYGQPVARSPQQQQQYFPNAGSSPGMLSAPQHKKKYQCTTCGRGFTTGGHLARHRRIHTGERNHICPFPGCETRCSRQDNLQQQRTTGQATRVAMQRAMKQSAAVAAPPQISAVSQVPSSVQHPRLPPIDTKEEFDYGPHQLTSPISPYRPPPPDMPPPLECAYGAGGSVSSHSSARSSPELSPYPVMHTSARAASSFTELAYHPTHEHKAIPPNTNAQRGSQWELGSRSGPSSPDYDDEPSPGGAGQTYTDTDEGSSSGSSAGSPQTISPQGTPRSYGHSSSQQMSSQAFSSDRQHNLSPPASPISPATSQPPSPTYATSPATSFGHNFATDERTAAGPYAQHGPGIQPSYNGVSASLATLAPIHTHPSRVMHGIASPTHRQSVASVPQRYSHYPTATHPKYPSDTTLAPINVDRTIRSDDPRQADRRTTSIASHDQLQSRAPGVQDVRTHKDLDMEANSPAPELSSAYGQAPSSHDQQAHPSNASMAYSYAYSPLSPDSHQTWSADALRPRATLVH